METKPTVLVADDNADICDLLQIGLARLGVRVLVASNGREAYDSILANHPDLVLLDLMMPEMSGLEVLEKLRADDQYQHLPVIMITARTQDDDVERGYALGASDYVTKPFNLKDLMGKVAALLGLA